MREQQRQNVQDELVYQASRARSADKIEPVPPGVLDRYRHNRHWRCFPREYMFRLVHRLAPKSICDFGCGAGETAIELVLMGYKVTGFDLSPEMIDLCWERERINGVAGKAEFLVANASAGDLRGDQFDLIITEGVLHHVNLIDALRSLNRLLRPGGHVIIVEPVCFLKGVQGLKNLLHLGEALSPNEAPLTQLDLQAIREHFPIVEDRYFHLTVRLLNLFPGFGWRDRFRINLAFRSVDEVLLRRLPGAARFAGMVVLAGRKPAAFAHRPAQA